MQSRDDIAAKRGLSVEELAG